jgi:hypothetical protein
MHIKVYQSTNNAFSVLPKKRRNWAEALAWHKGDNMVYHFGI